MKDRSNDPSHHEWTLLPQSYISLLAEMDAATIHRLLTITLEKDCNRAMSIFGDQLSSLPYFNPEEVLKSPWSPLTSHHLWTFTSLGLMSDFKYFGQGSKCY